MGRTEMLSVWRNDVACGINYAMVSLLLFTAIFVWYEYLIISFMLYNDLFQRMKNHIFDEWIECTEWIQLKVGISTLIIFFLLENMKKSKPSLTYHTLFCFIRLNPLKSLKQHIQKLLEPQTGLIARSNRRGSWCKSSRVSVSRNLKLRDKKCIKFYFQRCGLKKWLSSNGLVIP